jgi:glycosyltransferase involved in cell wall biosynthesis
VSDSAQGHAGPDASVAGPDVSVVVPVHNTMPYLTRCLSSLVEQTIGADRLEVIAVDDGSTDGSGPELDRFARLHPDVVRVVHQENTGGPAGPCNRGLDLATGRYVFFVGADDYLGREALERLVAAADRWDSDVVLGRVVGVNSRHVNQAVFASTEPDIGLFTSALPWSLANTKLFRRDLIERHGLRFREDMPIGSDQPFTIEACFRARRISVLADYTYYYAVRRLNALNITYRSRHVERLRSVESIMNFVADLIGPGKQRDAILVRHFSLELAKLLEDDFLGLDTPVQERVQAGARALVQAYLTETIRDQLGVETRLRLSLASSGSLADLVAVIRQDAERGIPPTVVEGDRWFAAYPGFRDPHLSLPDSWFDVTDTAADWIAKVDATSASFGRGTLTITAQSPVADLATLKAEPAGVTAGPVAGTISVASTSEGTGTTLLAHFDVGQLVAATAPLGGRLTVQTQARVGGATGSAAVRAPRLARPWPRVRWQEARPFVVAVTKDHSGRLMVAVTHITPRRVLARLLRRFSSGGKK